MYSIYQVYLTVNYIRCFGKNGAIFFRHMSSKNFSFNGVTIIGFPAAWTKHILRNTAGTFLLTVKKKAKPGI